MTRQSHTRRAVIIYLSKCRQLLKTVLKSYDLTSK